MIYKTFEEWKAGQWLEDGEPRTEAYTEDELLLVEMGWKYGFDAGKQQQKPLSAEDIGLLSTDKRFDYIHPQTLLMIVREIEERHGIK